MKSKITKIQKILTKGIAVFAAGMMLTSPMVYAVTSLDDSYLESSWLDKLLYGSIGSTAKEIAEHFNSGETTLYITNETQLRALAEYVNNGKSCSGKQIILLNDIEVDKNNEWVPIGNKEKTFNGIFNGNGYTISGVTYLRAGKSDDNMWNIGLFGVTGSDSIIKNLTTDNFNINVLYDEVSYEYHNVGNIVGSNAGTIENCINKSNIYGSRDLGGIVGYNRGTVKDCLNTGNVLGYDRVGGISGGNKDNSGTIINSINNGNISGKNCVGGIAGSGNKIINCTNFGSGNISGTNGGVGGIAGVGKIIEFCDNAGDVTGNNAVGGIAGIADGYGGKITNNINKGRVIASYDAGGIVGRDLGINVENCFNQGYIIANEKVAGIVGNIGITGTVSNCTNEGSIEAKNNYAAGILNASGTIIVRNSLNKGSIDCVGTNVNGIANEMPITPNLTGKVTIDNCGHTGRVNNVASNQTAPEGIGFNDDGLIIGAVKETGNEIIENIDSTKGLTATFEMPKGYFNADKNNNVINVEVIFNKKLYTALGTSDVGVTSTTAPKLTMTLKNSNGETEIVNLVTGNPTISNDITTINYTLEITDDIVNGQVQKFNLVGNATYYAVTGTKVTDSSKWNTEYRVDRTSFDKEIINNGIYIDTVKPIINTKVYVENILETERYTAGKEIIFEVKTSEPIQGLYEVPQIQVSFSESGVGKYNYNEQKGAGFAKCKDAKINVDGTTTWTFTYQVQERDEGQLEFTFTAGKIRDLAGNITNIKELYAPSTGITSTEVKGTQWNNDLGVTYEFYKNSVSTANKVTSQTYFTNTDDLIVVAKFDKVLYVHYGLSDGKNTNVRLNNSHKDRAPSLYLNADSILKQSSIDKISTTEYVESTQTSGTTTVHYKFTDIAKNYGLKNLTQVSKVVLKNENNEENVSTNGTSAATNGMIPYAEEWYSEYHSEQEEKYNKTLTSGKIKTTDGLDDILIDPIGVSEKIEKSNIYADTTAPTVKITADKSNPTSANEILYTFEFNEIVEGFEASDITVNNGVKATKTVVVDEEEVEQEIFDVIEEGRKYTLLVKPTITDGNEGVLQVIVEEGAAKDLVAINNVRQEMGITIDKVRPTFTSYEIKEESGKVIIDLTFNEAISDLSGLEPTLTVGGKDARGTWEDKEVYDNNKVRFVYNVSGADGGKVEVTLAGTVKDIAGNDSEKLNIQIENDINLEQEVISNGKDIYSFEKNGRPILDFTNPTYFVKGDKITVIKDTETEVEVEVDGEIQKQIEIVTEEYSYILEDENDLAHMKFMKIGEKINEEEETIFVPEFYTTKLYGRVDISEANIWFDTKAPTVTTEITVNNKVENDVYGEGAELTIKATTSEKVSEYEVPEINVVFGENAGKFNNGKAEFIETIENKNGTSTAVYKYVISVGDEGKVSYSYEKGKVVDLAGNVTNIRNLNSEEGNFVVDNIVADTTIPTLTITNDVENPTNADKIVYTFEFSEKVEGFEESDITVNNGSKGTFTKVTDGLKYTLEVMPTITSGNQGEVQVIVEQNACIDKVGLGNVRQEMGITIDKVRPTFTSYEIKEESGKVIIETIFSEAISDVSGLEPTLTVGGKDARGTWEDKEVYDNNKVRFVYNVSGADGGKVEVTLAGTVKDIAGNDSEKLNIQIESDINLEQKVITDGQYIYAFEKNGRSILDFTNPTYFVKGDKITVVKYEDSERICTYEYTIEDKDLDYSHMKYMNLVEHTEGKQLGKAKFSTSKNTGSIDISEANIWFDTVAPIVTTEITANNKVKNDVYGEAAELTIKATTSEKVSAYEVPEINVKFGENAGKFNNGKAEFVETIENENGTSTAVYKYVIFVGDEGEVSLSYENERVVDLAGNNTILTNLNQEEGIFILNNIVSDTTIPTLEITTDVENPANADKIVYTFEFSEKVEGFEESDITVNNGSKGTFTKITDGLKYTLEVVPTISLGNEGEVQVIVEQNACIDKVGLGNVRQEYLIRVDKIAPIFIGLESYAESAIKLDSSVDTVKQYYKAGDTVKIVATFTENIEKSTAPALALQFSESGNAEGIVSTGAIKGNKITYTYTITEKDLGTLSVKGFSGKVVDSAGNETVVTKRILTGDTIIADTINPELVGITAIAPDFEYDELLQDGETKRYGITSKTRENNTITIIAEYSENVYSLNSNTISKITNVPVLSIKFGTGTTRIINTGIVEGNKITYTYNIQQNDNGELSIVSLKGTVSDIAGNTLTTSTSLPTLAKYEVEIAEENKVDNITADTTRSSITSINATTSTSVNYDDNGNKITGNGSYYRKGAVITITATTNEYVYKNADKSLVRFTNENAPTLNISFATRGTGVGTCTNVEYKDNKTVFTYTYTIKENDNGQLSLNIAENVGYDIALNGNYVKQDTKSIYADTVNPVTNWQSWVESEGYGIVDNLNGTWEVTFSEKLYVYDNANYKVGSELSNANKPKAPILLVSKDNSTALETTITNITTKTINGIQKTVITYKYADYTKNIGAYGMKFASVSDKAGNVFNLKDQVPPTLSNIKVTSPATGTYKAGEVITIVATFSEKLNEKSNAPTLALKFSESGDAKGKVSQGVITGNTITYTYTITAHDNKGNGDNGILQLKSYTGKGLLDLSDNEWVEETKSLTGNRITADTISPVITKVEAKVDDKVIGSYDQSTEEYVAGRTNADTINYVVTFSENITLINKDVIEITNGKITDISHKDNQVTVTVKTTTEGVQSLIIPADVVADVAGNRNEFFRFNGITIDFTKSTVRFISEYNGGAYVLPTSIGKVEIRPNVEISEDISKIEYKWDNEEYAVIDKYSGASDIVVPTKEVTKAGEYTLYIRVTDVAGNVTVASKEYTVLESEIDVIAKNEGVADNAENKLAPINGNVIVTVKYGEGLTDNRKVSFKPEGSTEAKEISPNTDGTYTITENGTVYAEATDKVGNKVFYLYGSEIGYSITNIDRIAPVIEFSEVPYGILKDEPIDIYIFTDEISHIKYSWDNQNWLDYTEKLAHAFRKTGEHTLYVRAYDEAENRSTSELTIYVSALDFEVYGNTDYWTVGDVELYVSTESEIASIKVNEKSINVDDGTYVVEENGEYVFVVTDKYGNTATKTIKVEKIDKESPIIEKVVANEKEITITAKDEKSGILEYAITLTTEVPVEWSESKVIKTTKDGTFYVWAKDNAGNVVRAENTVTVDTTAPTITFNYNSLTVTQGQLLETNIATNEDAIISYSWDNKQWVDSEELLTSLKVEKESTTAGKYTVYVKAKDNAGNESKVQTLEFNVIEEIKDIKTPEIIFEDLVTIQVDGVQYVKVSTDMTMENITEKMDKEALCGKTPEYTKLTEDKVLKTGSEITIDGKTKYVIVVNGDVNCDGKVDFLGDVILANNSRIGVVNLNTIQKLAADINNSGTIEFIPDIIAMNNYRLGIINSL